jgi:hypothetical protein
VSSRIVRAGRTAYFIDVKETWTGAKYDWISEHHIDERGKKGHLVIRIFGESGQIFHQRVAEAVSALY